MMRAEGADSVLLLHLRTTPTEDSGLPLGFPGIKRGQDASVWGIPVTFQSKEGSTSNGEKEPKGPWVANKCGLAFLSLGLNNHQAPCLPHRAALASEATHLERPSLDLGLSMRPSVVHILLKALPLLPNA